MDQGLFSSRRGIQHRRWGGIWGGACQRTRASADLEEVKDPENCRTREGAISEPLNRVPANDSIDPARPDRGTAAPALTQSKLSPPRLPATAVALERHRKWLAPILDHSLCLVRAESGYGKSTMCVSWYHALKAKGLNVGWVSFSRDDDEPTRAISYIAAAARKALGPAEFEEDWIYDGIVPPHLVATRFINSILAFERPVILFLDDPDRLSDTRTLQFLNYVLLHCPNNLHLVLACQTQPPLPLTHLDHQGTLLRIGVGDLRLTDSEARDLLAENAAALKDDDIQRLNAAMGGWVTGLRIGSAALRNNRDALADIGLVSRGAQWMSDYLDENIFQHLTPTARQFLMRCAVVETMTPGLCEALSGEPGAAKMLAWLADQNLFVQRLDEAGDRFRIHPIFREFLLTRFDDDEPLLLPSLHKTASGWFAGEGMLAEAISHALDAGDAEHAAGLIDLAAMKMVERSEIITLLGWIARIPETAIAHRMPTRIAQAWALTLCLRPQARDLIDELHKQAGRIENASQRAATKSELAGIETILLAVLEDRLDVAIDHGNAFLSKPRDENSFVTRAVRNAVAYCEYNRGEHQRVHDLLRPAQIHAQRSEQLFPTAYRTVVTGMTHRAQGQLGEAERVLREGLELAESVGGAQSVSAALVSAFLGRCLYERNDLTGAAAVVEERLPVIDEACFPEAVINAYLVSVRCAALGGRIDKAAALIEHAEILGHERKWNRLLGACIVERTRLGLPLNMPPDRLLPIEAEDIALSELMTLPARTSAILLEARAYEALVAGDVERVGDVSRKLARLAHYACCQDLKLKSAMIALLPHLFGLAEGDVDPEIAAQLEKSAQFGFQRTILDMIEARTGHRLSSTLPANLPASFLQIVGQAGTPQSWTATQDPRPANANTVFSILTSREIDVLTGVSRGQSNKEIARQLHLTPETVKWHLKNVMRKLNAENRATAVRNAARIGLSAIEAQPAFN